MFFEKVEKKSIDGTSYEISNPTANDIWSCRTALNDIYQALDTGTMEMTVNPDSYTTWKKELIKMLKEFDKCYVKHMKGAYVEMNAIH